MSDKSQRVRDPEGTRTAIIDTAERLFAENGFAATSMRESRLLPASRTR